MLGALLSTLPLAALVATIGWRRALGGVGILTLALAALCMIVVRDRPSGVAAPRATTLRVVLAGALEVLRNPHTWPPFLAFFCLYSAAGNLMLWIVPCLRDVYALDARPAAFYAMATSLALLVAGPFTGWLRIACSAGARLLYAVLSSLQVVLWTVFVLTLGALPLAGLYALLFAMGLAGGLVRARVADRTRGESTAPRWRRRRRGELRRVPGGRPHAGTAGRRARRALDRGPGRRRPPLSSARPTAPALPSARRSWPGPPCSAC